MGLINDNSSCRSQGGRTGQATNEGWPSIEINRARAQDPPGGDWTLIDPVGQGRVQVLPAGDTPITQSLAAKAELNRLSGRVTGWDWSKCTLISRNWSYLDPVRSLCELAGIPVQMAIEEFTGICGRPAQWWTGYRDRTLAL